MIIEANNRKTALKGIILTNRNSIIAALMIAYNIICTVLQQVLQLDIAYGNIVGAAIIAILFTNGLMNAHFRDTSTNMRIDMGISYALLPL
jgi:uncharacterized membrane protein